ncbi:sigma 54-interacting transcriptional regulator [Shewanella abyssi]|uniref:sigma-54-dependent Fis family transcriptional regulator n=1 Tax=Shewanella abyssi TaxID=311789 RepID=UPI00200D912F|nr:sigma-54-dependent Fis family transcriptional regulator [Shewanella abyssi]MCL1051672.1 sigma 54-interacting transcriptional regulator [Shewanella abyssi]
MKASELNLEDVFSFGPQGGHMQFMGRRVLLFDALAMGLLRKELIDNIGSVAARNILTRMGYAHGWATADNLDNEYCDLLQRPDFGPRLHQLQGLVNIAKCDWTFEPKFRGKIYWEDSYEAEQQLLQFGVAHEPACWMLTGYVSGYCSRMLREEVYCIEKRCSAIGDPVCEAEARTKADWGDEIEPYLPYFQAETIENVLHEVTAKLAKVEKQSILTSQFTESSFGKDIVARSSLMRKTKELAIRIAKVESTVIISGESGVGKEKIARLIHHESARTLRSFVAINCSAVTETLLESEFFGHAKGAFTGANKDRMGLFEAASGGTLFLDEIGELSASMQAKLLRVLQEKEIRRVGENKSRSIDVRIVAATNRNLVEEVASGNFREDLYYRLCVFELEIPPLRQRPEDILLLSRHFLKHISEKMGKDIIGFTPEVIELLLQFRWPGNVRQLENTIEHAVVMCQRKRIKVEDLPRIMSTVECSSSQNFTIKKIDELEKEHIISALITLKGNKAEAAKSLGISLSSLYQKVKRYGCQDVR